MNFLLKQIIIFTLKSLRSLVIKLLFLKPIVNFLKKRFKLFKIKILTLFKPPKYRRKYLIKSYIYEDNKREVISLINKNDVKLDFKDKLELVQYAIEQDKKEISKSLIKQLTNNISRECQKLKDQEKRINNLEKELYNIKNKKEKQEEKKEKAQGHWYSKFVNVFNNKDYSENQRKIEENLKEEKEKLNIYYKNIKVKEKQLFCENNDINQFIDMNNNNIIALNLRVDMDKLNNAILSINNLLLERENNERLAI